MANIKISQLPSQSTLVDTTVFPTVNASTNYKLSASAIRTYITNGTVTTFTGQIVPGTGARTGQGILTVTNGTAGQIAIGQSIEGVTIAADTYIVTQLTGTSGGNGTYVVSISQTKGPETMNVSSIYIDAAIKLQVDHGIFQQDSHDTSLYNLLIGIKQTEATIHIGDINTNGISLTNNKEYKVESALNLGTYMAVAKVDASDNVILASGNSVTTQIRAGGITGSDPYGIKIKNGGEVHIPYGMNIGSNQGNQAFGASLEINSDAAIDSTGGYAGISLVSYRTTDANGPFGSFAYGARYRGTTNSPVAVAQDDTLMEFGGLGWDGAALNGGGEILWAVDGTVAAGSTNPSRIEFYNTATNAKDQSLGMVIYASKKVQIYGDLDSSVASITAFATPTTLSIGTATGATTYNFGTGATTNSNTKAINIGTAGVSGSTTNITLGSSVSGATSTTTINSSLKVKDVRDTIYSSGSTTGTITPDCANGAVQTITLTGSITLNAFANPVTGQTMTLIITQPASGGPYTLTSSMKFANGLKTLSTAASAIDMLTISYIGTTYYASLVTGFA